MRHYTVNLMLAFVFLSAINLQKESLIDSHRITCSFLGEQILYFVSFYFGRAIQYMNMFSISGFAIQFFFITSFTLMCVMSVETYIQIR